MSREKETHIFPYFVTAVMGFNVCNLLHAITDNTDETVAAVQTHNAQVREQLIPTYKGMGQLVLDEEHDTFVFTIDSTEYPDQSCRGGFEVRNNVAVATGNIACTEQHEVGGQ